jgi:hypothetical protein
VAVAQPVVARAVLYTTIYLTVHTIFKHQGEIEMPEDTLMMPMTQEELAAAKRRREADKLLAEKLERGRLATQKSREKKKAAEAAEKAIEPVETMWTRNSKALFAKALFAKDATLYRALEDKHLDVRATEAEVLDIVSAVKEGKRRAETLSALTPDPENVFPMPDVAYRDLREMPTASYVTIEAMTHPARHDGEGEHGESSFRPQSGEKFSGSLDDVVGCYRFFGFRLAPTSDCRRDCLDFLLLYALRSGDATLDWTFIKEIAIPDWRSSRGWYQNEFEIARLLKERGFEEPPPAPAMFKQKRKS